MQLTRTLAPAQALHALGNGATGNHQRLDALSGQHGQLPAPIANGAGIHATPLIGDQGSNRP
jgi:hypothetical protein